MERNRERIKRAFTDWLVANMEHVAGFGFVLIAGYIVALSAIMLLKLYELLPS